MQEFQKRFDKFYEQFTEFQEEVKSELSKQGGVWKVMPIADHVESKKFGFIPNQPADIDCPFIHACDYGTIPDIIKKFYSDHEGEVKAYELNIEQAAREGFTIKYESNRPGGVVYWHLYRPEDEPNKLLSNKCLE